MSPKRVMIVAMLAAVAALTVGCIPDALASSGFDSWGLGNFSSLASSWSDVASIGSLGWGTSGATYSYPNTYYSNPYTYTSTPYGYDYSGINSYSSGYYPVGDYTQGNYVSGFEVHQDPASSYRDGLEGFVACDTQCE